MSMGVVGRRFDVGVATYGFTLTVPTIALFLVVLILLAAAAVFIFRRRYLWATTMFVLSLLGSAVFLTRSLVADTPSWQVMLAAISNTSPAQSQVRAEDLKAHWDTDFDEILLRTG
jgi:hypothetical protein